MFLDFKRLPILETERLRLSPIERSDADHVFPILSGAGATAFWDGTAAPDPDRVDAIVESQVAANQLGQAVYWSARALKDGVFLGCCDLAAFDRRWRRGEVGFLFGRRAWSEGLAAEAMGAVVAYAGAAGVRKLAARARLGDRRAERLLEAVGFTGEGRLRGEVARDGERRDCRVFGLLL
jgi:RimJ/RimL family protein N-acetyltransferase